MHRYVALIWNSYDQEQNDTARLMAQRFRAALPNWTPAIDKEGMLVLHFGHQVGQSLMYPIGRQAGVVLGKLFRKNVHEHSAPAEVSINEIDEETILGTEGKILIDEFWGRYVAFVHDKEQNCIYVLRDPSGGLFCYRTEFNLVHLYFSRVEDVKKIGLIDFSTNWEFLVANFLDNELVNEKTGISNVTEIGPGECHKIQNGKVTRNFFWDPRIICRSDVIYDFDEALDILRKTTQTAINSWAATYDGIVHNLSGGLDSAIVLGCFVKSPKRPEVVCLNYYTEGQASDERSFARLAAQQAGCELVEIPRSGSEAKIDQIVSNAPLEERPSLNMYGCLLDQIQAELAKERGAQAFTSGEGGDHVFFQLKMVLNAADYIRDNGIDSNLIQVLIDTARLTRKSFWSALQSGFIYGLLRRNWYPQSLYPEQYLPFLKQAAIESVPLEYALHPWSRENDGIGPNKQTQIFFLPKALNRHPAFGRSEVADVIHPLFSQPIVEACLRIPCYLLSAGGRDRGLARKAFVNHAPNEILTRRSKGGTSSYYARMCAEGLPFIRRYVMDGLLGQADIVNSAELDRFLSIESIARDANIRTILKLVAVEAWLRRWADSQQKVAA